MLVSTVYRAEVTDAKVAAQHELAFGTLNLLSTGRHKSRHDCKLVLTFPHTTPGSKTAKAVAASNLVCYVDTADQQLHM